MHIIFFCIIMQNFYNPNLFYQHHYLNFTSYESEWLKWSKLLQICINMGFFDCRWIFRKQNTFMGHSLCWSSGSTSKCCLVAIIKAIRIKYDELNVFSFIYEVFTYVFFYSYWILSSSLVRCQSTEHFIIKWH